MIGSLASVPLPDSKGKTTSVSPLYADAQQDELRMRYGIEVPIIPWPAAPKRLLRISAQMYNALPEYQGLGQALRRVLWGQGVVN
jgi:isopenicillin-N epimerase